MKKGKKEKAHGQEKGSEKGLRAQLQEMRETLQRVQAEFENSCKRMEREKQEFSQRANAAMCRELLQVVDAVDAAEKNLGGQEKISKEDAVKGIELLRKQLLEILQGHGLQEIRAVGEQFDPRLHEAVMQGNEGERKENEVLEEFQRGYLLNGKVLRHSKVKVNKRGDEGGKETEPV